LIRNPSARDALKGFGRTFNSVLDGIVKRLGRG
jgi:hypothetical protein